MVCMVERNDSKKRYDILERASGGDQSKQDYRINLLLELKNEVQQFGEDGDRKIYAEVLLSCHRPTPQEGSRFVPEESQSQSFFCSLQHKLTVTYHR
jgi:hypothetical protein